MSKMHDSGNSRRPVQFKIIDQFGDINSAENMALLLAIERDRRDENPVIFSTTSFMFSPTLWKLLRQAGLVDVAEKLELMVSDKEGTEQSDDWSDETFALRNLFGLLFQAGRIAEEIGLPNATEEYLRTA